MKNQENIYMNRIDIYNENTDRERAHVFLLLSYIR